MGTLLLLGEHTTIEPLATAEGDLARRSPSFRGAFERVGYDVVDAEDGVGALRRLSQWTPDVIVLAGPVPDMDLFDLCTALRHDPATLKTPLVLVADAAERTGRVPSRTGADLVFPSSIGPVEIADRLRRLL